MLPRYERPARRPADERSTGGPRPRSSSSTCSRSWLFVTGVTTTALVLFVVLYVSRAFFVTAGYHRYFAHRSYRMARVPQLLMAIGGSTAVQKGPLWWAQHHRDHHRYADTDRDPHSPQRGFWWSHVLWFVSERYATTDLDAIEDFAVYPELRWLNRYDWVAPWVLGRDVLADRRLERPGLRLLRLHRAAVARHVRGELVRPHLRQPPLRHERLQPQQRGDRPPDARRGLAQQPPPLPAVGPPGLPLVADRHLATRSCGS